MSADRLGGQTVMMGVTEEQLARTIFGHLPFGATICPEQRHRAEFFHQQ
jgi:hypothetical protein